MRLTAGEIAPEFTLPVTAHPLRSTEKQLSLADLRGSWVVLYFYPRDLTPGCTLEGQDFTGLLPEFGKQGAYVLGVSKDDLAKHQRFCTKSGIEVPLLSDAEGDVSERYGVWQEKQMAGRHYMGIVRSTFLIDPEGRIAEVWSPVRTKGHAEAVLKALSDRTAAA